MWLNNVKEAVLALFVWEGLLAFLVQIDRIGNALAGGNPKATVSGRVGYYAKNSKNPLWKVLQASIDFSFYPIDGEKHCLLASYLESNIKHNRSSDWAIGFLGLIVVATCPFISVFTYGRKIWVG